MLQIRYSVKKQALLLQVIPDILLSPRWCLRCVSAARVKRETGVEAYRAWITCAAPATVSAVRLHRMPLRNQTPWEGDAATWSEIGARAPGTR
jgi:hypothetical protein